MRSHNAMHLSKYGVSFARYYSVEILRSFQKFNIPCKGAASRLRAYVYNAAFLQRGICILFRTYSSIIMRSIPLVQCTYTHIRQKEKEREIYIYIYIIKHVYIYTCSVIMYNFDLPGAALQARQSSVQILSIPLRCWTWRLSFKCAIFLGGEVLTIKENSIPKCIFICGSFQSHIRARIKTMWLLHSAISIQLNVVYSALYLCLGCSRSLERFWTNLQCQSCTYDLF